jgi:hypothetical protein
VKKKKRQPRWYNSERAMIGYKIKLQDWIVVEFPFGGGKGYQVTRVTRSKAICDPKSKNRSLLKFPRYYTLPFEPLEKKAKPDYKSPNKWHVRVYPSTDRLRLKYD